MNQTADVGLINQFLARIFGAIDDGFGLIAADVNHLFNMLIVLNIVLAGIWWAYGARDAIEGLLRRVLMIGFFAFVLNNWAALSNVIFQSFAILGLKASGDRLTLAEFMNPGTVAHLGVQLVQEFGEKIGELSIWDAFFVTVLLTLAAIIVLAAFFVIAIQIFVSLVVFKISTLAAFTLIPFAIFSKTSFIAERPLGYVVSAGVRLFIIAALVSISYDLFSSIQLTGLSLEQTAGITLGAVALAVLSFVAPKIAGDIISGGPSLGGGTALAGAAAGVMVGGAGLAALRSGAGALVGRRGSDAVAAAATALPAPAGDAGAMMPSSGVGSAGSGASSRSPRGSRSIAAASSLDTSSSSVGGTASPTSADPSSPAAAPGSRSTIGSGGPAATAPRVESPQTGRGTLASSPSGSAGDAASGATGWLTAGWRAATQQPAPVASTSAAGQGGRTSGPPAISASTAVTPSVPESSSGGMDALGSSGVSAGSSLPPAEPITSAMGPGEITPPLSIGPAPEPQDARVLPWRPTLMEQLNQVRLATPDGDGGAGLGAPIQHPRDE